MTKTFRVQYKTIGLTYSRCPLPKKEIVEFLQGKIQLEHYYVVQETHKETKGCKFHIHAWIKLANKPNIRNCQYFDIKGHHPNIIKAQKSWVYNYLKKQDTAPLTNLEEGPCTCAESGNVALALERFKYKYPKEYALNYERLKKNFQLMSRKERKLRVYPFTGDTVEWPSDTKSLMVIDKPGTGKTEWAKSFVTHHLKQTFLRVTHIDALKRYNGEDFIIYDDVSFLHLPRETQIHIAEVANDREIHCRHRPAYIPPGVKQIFVCNEHPFSLGEAAIDRRLHLAPLIRFYIEEPRSQN